MLCQIERCCRYAETHDRTVLIDTEYRNTRAFRDRFSRYFVSRQDRVVLKTDHLSAYADLTDVFPTVAAGRLEDYRTRWDRKAVRCRLPSRCRRQSFLRWSQARIRTNRAPTSSANSGISPTTERLQAST